MTINRVLDESESAHRGVCYQERIWGCENKWKGATCNALETFFSEKIIPHLVIRYTGETLSEILRLKRR